MKSAYSFNDEVKKALTNCTETVKTVEHLEITHPVGVTDETIIDFVNSVNGLPGSNVFFSRIDETRFVLVVFLYFEEKEFCGGVTKLIANAYVYRMNNENVDGGLHHVKALTFFSPEDIEEMDSEDFATTFIEAHEAYIDFTKPLPL